MIPRIPATIGAILIGATIGINIAKVIIDKDSIKKWNYTSLVTATLMIAMLVQLVWLS